MSSPLDPEMLSDLPRSLKIFDGAINSLRNGKVLPTDFTVSHLDVCVNFVPYLIEQVPALEDLEASSEALRHLSAYTSKKANDRTALIDFPSWMTLDNIPANMKDDVERIIGVKAISPITVADLALRSVVRYGKETESSARRLNATDWQLLAQSVMVELYQGIRVLGEED